MFLKTPFRLLCALLLALALPHGQAFASNDDVVIYEVKKGDTLYSLAQKYMRSYRSALTVQRLNKIRNPRRLPIGKKLRIPRSVLKYTPLQLTIRHHSGGVSIPRRSVSVGAKVSEGDTISTAGNGFIRFVTDSGKQFTMPSNSVMFLGTARRYRLNNIEDIDFEVRKGRGTTKSRPLKSNDRLRVRTPVATTAVRGTEFRTAFAGEAGSSITEVLEGSVNLAVGEETGVAEAGFGVASTQSGLGSPEALLAPGQLVDATRPQTGQTLDFAIKPQEGAARYRVQIAADQAGLEVIDEKVVSGTTVSFDSLDDQRYAVLVRGISASGVEGRNSDTYSFLRKRLGVAGGSEQSDLLDGFLFKWGGEGEGNSLYAFQMWRDNQPQQLLIDETGLSQTSLVLTNLAPATYKWRVAVMQADAQEGLLKVWGDTYGLVVEE